MKRVLIGILVAVVLGLLALSWWTRSPNSNQSKILTTTKEADMLARGREIAKTAPKLGTQEWMIWHKGLSADDRMAWAVATDEMLTPPEPTQAQKGAVRIENWQPPSVAQIFPAKVLFNYRPLLRMDKSVGLRPLQVETARTASGGMITTMWARRAKDSIVIDWDNNTVVKGNVDNIKSVGGPSPQYVPHGMLLIAGNGELGFTCNGDGFVNKWERSSTVYPLALDEKSNYAFGSEKGKESGRIESVVVVDTANKKLVGRIPVPPANNGLHCIFESNDYLMVFDYESNWIMLLDLKNPTSHATKATAK
jgi:hypothetical protein